MKQFQNNSLTKFLNFSESNMTEHALLFLKILIWFFVYWQVSVLFLN